MTWPIDWVAPRSTWIHCGSLKALDQRVPVFPSTALPGTRVVFSLDEEVAGLFSARFGFELPVGVTVGVLVRVAVGVGVFVKQAQVGVSVGVSVGVGVLVGGVPALPKTRNSDTEAQPPV